jgi:hypothetical protein
VDNLLDDTTNVTVTLGVIEVSELGSSLSQTGMRGEDRASTLSLIANNTTCKRVSYGGLQ